MKTRTLLAMVFLIFGGAVSSCSSKTETLKTGVTGARLLRGKKSGAGSLMLKAGYKGSKKMIDKVKGSDDSGAEGGSGDHAE